jgi:hypothetical protein
VSKLSTFANAGAVLISNVAKVATELPAATNGQVLTLVDGVPTWVDTFVPAQLYFEVTLAAGTQQLVNILGVPETVEFRGIRLDPFGAYDSTNARMPVAEGQVWFFYAQLQLSEPGAATTNAAIELNIRKNGSTAPGNTIAAFTEAADMTYNTNVQAMGILKIEAGETYVDVGVTVNAAGGDLDIDANATNTRFGGFRIL